jgi:hypothetical protein
LADAPYFVLDLWKFLILQILETQPQTFFRYLEEHVKGIREAEREEEERKRREVEEKERREERRNEGLWVEEERKEEGEGKAGVGNLISGFFFRI